MRLVITLGYQWTCSSCGGHNTSHTEFRTEYLRAKCGHCHLFTLLDYHRKTDAPRAALTLDVLKLDSMTSLSDHHHGYRGAYNARRRNSTCRTP
jgi:hypothetical protein